MLSPEETLALIERAQNNDEDAKAELLQNNIPLIKSIVRRYQNKQIEYEDLLQLGTLGFIKAVNNFDASFGVRFSTYAVPMIAGEIKRYIRDNGDNSACPSHSRDPRDAPWGRSYKSRGLRSGVYGKKHIPYWSGGSWLRKDNDGSA